MGFCLISSAFKNNGYIPSWYSRSKGDASPPIGWTKPPKGTRSLSLIVSCKDPNSKNLYCHWLMYNIPPRERTIFGNQPHKDVMYDGALQGINSYGSLGWDGPDDEVRDQVLVFTLFAVDRKLDLPPGASQDDVKAAMEGHIIEQTSLVGRY